MADLPKVVSDASERLDKIYQILDVSDDVKERLRHPDVSLQVAVPVRMDNGALKVFPGWRVQYNTVLGPAKGGIRFHPHVNAEEVTALSFWMAIKNAVVELPYGGGKGGVQVNPKELSKLELERLSRSYIRAIRPIIGPDTDIPAPDVNTNETVMSWMVDEFSQLQGRHSPAVITGKPIGLGGSEGRTAATGLGALKVLNMWVKKQGKSPEDMTVAVQGFGNAGYYFATNARKAGYKVVAVSDSKGAVYSEDGLDPDKIYQHKHEKQELKGFVYCDSSVSEEPETRQLSNDELLELDVDVLVLAALEDQITEDNANNINAKLVLEIANGPVSHEGEKILLDRNIPVIPDVLANTGGVIVSYMEWVQNRAGDYWSAEKVEERLTDRIERAATNCFDLAAEHELDLRTAAYLKAIKRLADAADKRGNQHYFNND
ncbi:MAG: Glu/Leu/Phe/Val dehydrogenase [Idiomarina sp.]